MQRTGDGAYAQWLKRLALTTRFDEAAARAGEELMPPIVDCVREYASIGEISDALRKVYGEYRPGS